MDQELERAMADLERRSGARLAALEQQVTGQLEALSRRQQEHAEKVTVLLDRVMAELGARTDQLTSETRAALDELRARTTELEHRKLNAADFGGALAALGQRLAAGSE